MSHPILYGEKDLALTSPTINVTTETTAGLNITGNITTPGVYGKTVASPQFVTISPTGIVGSEAIPPSGVLTLGAVDTHPNANAAIITGTQLQLEPANSSFPGVLSTTNQSIAGPKTFVNDLSTTGNFSAGTALANPTIQLGSPTGGTGNVNIVGGNSGATNLSFQTPKIVLSSNGGSFQVGPSNGSYQDSQGNNL